MNQDFVAWVGQGAVADRTQEHLGESDRGVIMMRRKMLEQAEVVADGGDPKGLVRDPEHNQRIYLPRVGGPGVTNRGVNFGANAGKAPRNQHLYGQPQEILDEMDAIWSARSHSTV